MTCGGMTLVGINDKVGSRGGVAHGGVGVAGGGGVSCCHRWSRFDVRGCSGRTVVGVVVKVGFGARSGVYNGGLSVIGGGSVGCDGV